MPPQPPEHLCPECEGTGWVIVEDGGAGTARPCECRKRELGRRLLESAGIPRRYAGCSLSTFVTSHPDPAAQRRLVRARGIAEGYVERFLGDEGRFRESGLLFYGPAGVGKTHLAAAILKALIGSYRVHGRFIDFTTLIHQIQSTFDPGSPESKREVLDPVIGADVLVLDELGAQKPTAWVQDVLYLVVNSRYTQRRPTVFTTNYPLERSGPQAQGRPESLDRGADPPGRGPRLPPLEERITAQLVSRLFEMARPVSLEGVSDHRKEVMAEQARM